MTEYTCIVCGRRFTAEKEHKWVVTGHKKVCSYTCMNEFTRQKELNNPNAIERRDKDGNLLETYKNVWDASEKTGLDDDTIRRYLRKGYCKNTKEIWHRKNIKSIDKNDKK